MLVLPYRLALTLRASSQTVARSRMLVALTLVLSLAGSARAQRTDDSEGAGAGVVAAATAFTQGQQAELSGNYEQAAELFELADRIAPTPEALRSATRNRLSAGQLASAASDAEELLRRYESDAPSRELAEKVLTRAKPELARFTFQCTEPCTVVVDGYASGTLPLDTQVVYVSPGAHELSIGFEGVATRGLRIQGSAGESRIIKVARPVPSAVSKTAGKPNVGEQSAAASTRETRAAQRRRLSPAYFWLAAGATVATGAVTVWSGLDLIKSRDDFKASARPTQAQFDDGESKDRRTSVLIVASSVLAVGTVALGMFTDFRGTRDERAQRAQRPSASISIDRHAAQLTYGGRF